MLVYEQDPNVLPFLCELIEGGFDGGGFCFGVDDEEVFGGGGRGRYVLGWLGGQLRLGRGFVLGGKRTPIPARRRPVTES